MSLAQPTESPRRLQLRETLAGKHLFVTGATGFLGKVWLAHLLQDVPDIGSVSVLARTRQGRSAEERVRSLLSHSPAFRALRQTHGKHFQSFINARIRVLDGEVTRPGCGLRLDAQRALLERHDLSVHFAGITDFEADPRLALAVNVDGVRHLCALLAGAKHPRLQLCSTAFVAGNRSGDIREQVDAQRCPGGRAFDPVTALQRFRDIAVQHDEKAARVDAGLALAREYGWPNIYTFSKALAERWLHSEAPQVEATILRPSIVESARRYPFPGWNEGVNTSAPLVWLLSTPLRRFPAKPEHRFDVIPVDDVAKACTLVAGAQIAGHARAVYHVASGDRQPLNFDRAIDLTSLALRARFGRCNASKRERFFLQHLDAYAAPHARFQRQMLNAGMSTVRALKERLRRWPAQRYGAHAENLRKTLLQSLRMRERQIALIQSLLRVYLPFIRDNNYRFLTGNLTELTQQLGEQERSRFGFDLGDLDWYNYWLDVQVPGLQQWSLPLMRGERIDADVPCANAEALLQGSADDDGRDAALRVTTLGA